MRAAVLETIPGELVIADVRVDKPGPNEVLVRVAAAGLCHSDLHFMEAKYPHKVPAILGHEAAGVVEAVGDGTPTSRPATTSSRVCRPIAEPATSASPGGCTCAAIGLPSSVPVDSAPPTANSFISSCGCPPLPR